MPLERLERRAPLRARLRRMKAPSGWRHLVVDGRDYLWTLRSGRDPHHDPMRLLARRGERDADREILRGRGPIWERDTGMGSNLTCDGPQCGDLPPPRPITPGEVAEWIRSIARGS